ncbi:MAG: copper homeostasis protein CutC [Bacteroidales bacterium]|jgi:copper homeostasis protein|nr:copper homeostasis protein CutC [Bacteroidales bacterium]
MNFRLEICVDSAESSITAQRAGADRVEYCGNLYEGGTTPSHGSIAAARDNLTIGLHVLIRPRGGDFLYSDPEFDIMRRDIDICGEHGVDGIVAGILRPDGNIDLERTARLFESAYPMATTFHRAFDMCIDPVQGLEDVIASGATRLLTSGMKNRAADGLGLIRKLVLQAGKRIIIMPGGGISANNISEVASGTKAEEFHLTGRKTIESGMCFRREEIHMGGTNGFSEFFRKVANEDEIKKIVEILKMI